MDGKCRFCGTRKSRHAEAACGSRHVSDLRHDNERLVQQAAEMATKLAEAQKENQALKRTVTMCQLELRCIAKAVDDPRDNVTLTTAECIEALKKDAERYRWLRDWAGGGTITQLSHIEPDAWDAFVDGEMEETR